MKNIARSTGLVLMTFSLFAIGTFIVIRFDLNNQKSQMTEQEWEVENDHGNGEAIIGGLLLMGGLCLSIPGFVLFYFNKKKF